MPFLRTIYIKTSLLILCIGCIAVFYFYGFHKTFDAQIIPRNADGIAMIDIKNCRNFILSSALKNPSKWSSNQTKQHENLSNFGLETPNYLALFHLVNQPLHQWFAVAKVKNTIAFEKAITQYGFKKAKLNNGMSSFFSKPLSMLIVKHSNQILMATILEKEKPIATKTAEALFLKKQFLNPKSIEKTIDTENAITIWIKKNSFLKEDGIVNITLKDQEIVAEGQLKLHSKYRKNYLFLENPNAVLSIGFNFEMIQNQNFFKQNLNQINKIIGFNVDSLLVHHPTKTEIIVHEMVKKNDSVISYDYDDDFNPIKKVVVHTNREPSFYFSIQTENSKQVYDYLKNQNAIDKNQVFVNFPLAQTKTFVKNNTLTLKANPIKQASIKSSIPKMGYLQMNFSKLQTNDWRYLIGKNKNLKYLQSFEILSVNLKLENNQAHFLAHLKTNNRKSLITIMK